MWLFRTGEDGLPPIILYRYTQTRAGLNAADFLKGFKGYLETDCYQGYNGLPDVKRCCCWAHLRRYFVEAVPKGKELDYGNPAAQGVQYCNKLFEYERQSHEKGHSHEQRKEYRIPAQYRIQFASVALLKMTPICFQSCSWRYRGMELAGAEMEAIGKEFVRREFRFTPARGEVINIYRETAKCPVCSCFSGYSAFWRTPPVLSGGFGRRDIPLIFRRPERFGLFYLQS